MADDVKFINKIIDTINNEFSKYSNLFYSLFQAKCCVNIIIIHQTKSSKLYLFYLIEKINYYGKKY